MSHHAEGEAGLSGLEAETRTARIIIADDDRGMRGWLLAVLKGLDATFIEVDSSFELLDLVVGGDHVDLVITDVRMPPSSGLQVLTLVREAGLDTPFLVITAFPDDEVRARV